MSLPPVSDAAAARARGAPVLRAAVIYGGMIAAGIALFLVINAFGSRLNTVSSAAPGLADDAPIVGKFEALPHVLLALVAVLITSRLLASVFRFFGQPPVIGEVVGGILLGPSLLGWVWPEAMHFLFPVEARPFLGVIAEFGVILYMFLVGLELNHRLLRQQAQATIAISQASIIAPFVLGAGLALLLYKPLAMPGVPFTSFALFLGVAMAITAFPVLARILTDRNMQSTQLGAIALACAAANDVTAWCLLAFVVGVAQAQIAGALVVMVLTGLYIVFMVFVVQPLATRLLLRYDESHLPPSLMAMLLVALLASSLATHAIGVHALFGAFLLGAVIPHDSGVARALTHKLEDFVTILLLPAFFAFTGLRTQLGLVSGIDQWLLCGAIIVVATLGKFGGAFVAARIAGYPSRESAALGTLMNTRGLMELIVLNIGLDLNVIKPELFAMMVVMALVTTIATTPIVSWLMRGRDQEMAVG